ncbi:MAG: hypothetical protein JEZ03_08960 [Bacteroidales bacterium]|nr:hypothetical protein [Bacteroidales bacterium]
MNNFKYILYTTLLFIISTSSSFSQDKSFIHCGLSFPNAELSSTAHNNELSGGAEIGFNIGFQYIQPFSNTGFGLCMGIDMNYNMLKQETKNDFEDLFNENIKISHHKYLNFPIYAGLNYTLKLNNKFSLFTNLCATFNSLKITDEIIKNKSIGRKIATEYFVSHNIGHMVSGGLLINDNIMISLKYLGVKPQNIDGVTITDWHRYMVKRKLKVDIFSLSIGFLLK